MQSRKEIEKEIQSMKNQLKLLSNSETSKLKAIIDENEKLGETSSSLATLLKYMMDADKKNYLILKGISDRLERLEENLDTGYFEQEDQDLGREPYLPESTKLGKVQPISELDAKILQLIQSRDMACADDIKKHMGYNGRNAASARLNKLYKQGFLERYQLGHKVYYKFDAGKTTNTLIVSPPQ